MSTLSSLTFKNTWETFLRLDSQFRADTAPEADAAFLISKGIEPDAPVVLRYICEDVIPLVHDLKWNYSLEWYSFLIHDRASGVPTDVDDKDAYIHLRLSSSDADFDLKNHLEHHHGDWVMTRKTELSREIAGFDRSVLVGEEIDRMWFMLGEQSRLMVEFMEHHRAVGVSNSKAIDYFVLLKHVRQFLHFFSNMAQMRVA